MSIAATLPGPTCAQSRTPAPGLLGRLTFAAALVSSALATPAAAQVAIDRTEIIFDASGAGPRTVLINLHNEGEQRVQAVMRLEDWDRAEDGANNWYPYGTKKGSCGKVLSIFPLAASLEPGARTSVRVTLDSVGTATSECWAGAIVETVQPRTVAGRNVAYLLRTATKIYVQPAGIAAHGELAAMRVIAADSTHPGGPQLEVGFENTGTKHLVTSGEVQLRRADNSVAATVKVPSLYTLVGARSVTRLALPPLAPGRYVLLVILDYGGDELAAAQLEYEAR